MTDTYKYDNFTNEENIPKSVQLSANFLLKDFLILSDKVSSVKSQVGLSSGQIVQNLQYLSVNIAEKVKDEYSEMIIISGYKYKTDGSLSKHYSGNAFDCQFAGKAASDYFDIAKRLTQIIPDYDQILLNYYSFGLEMPWIHLAYNKNYNRRQVLTLFNGQTIFNGLSKLL
ncbi:MAG: hypothetical protein PHG08_00315 [Bacilli bacterium]|nr:hypothetical protein [Bacilli bacterium]